MDIVLNQKVHWGTLVELGKQNVAIGAEYVDGISFYWGAENTLVVNEDLMDIAGFSAAISALDVDAEVAQAALNELRIERDKLIAETDWWVLPDRTPTQAQLDYRQALRDITETYSSLDDVVWPVKPE